MSQSGWHKDALLLHELECALVSRVQDPRIKLAEIEAKAKAKTEAWSTIRHFVSRLSIVVMVALVMNALQSIVTAKPDAIHEIANVVKALNMSQITLYILAGSTSMWGAVEHRGRKRAIEKAGRLQRQLESSDSYNQRSGLTPTGDNPGDDNA